ncbi:MAG: sulfatase-like hydrolase/transferase [Granulosicoccus sp.]|nr:sulfatase-like hydrolase/transferase [Granulosicoccus sp.]
MYKHILLIVIDQFRADCVHGALADVAPLPNLRSLMDEAVTFTSHYTVTTPCGPSRASLLTGLYAMNHRSVRNGTPLSSRHQTIGSLLRQLGYESLLFGYTDTSIDPGTVHQNDPVLKNYEGLAAGFEEMVRMRLETPGAWIGYLKNHGYPEPEDHWDWYKPILDLSTATDENPEGSPIRSPACYSAQHSDTAYLTDRTLETWNGIERRNSFSLVTYIRPHPPLVAPAPYNTMVDPAQIPPPRRNNASQMLAASHPYFDSQLGNASSGGLYQGFHGRSVNLSDRHIAELRAVYLGLAAEVDHHIGRLLDWVKANGRYDDTLIVVTADHAEMLGDQYLWGKLAPHDAALHIPLIVRDPDSPDMQGRTVNAFTESIDIAPTLMQWANGHSVPAFNGRSLLPWLRGEQPSNWRSEVFSEAELGEPDEQTAYQRLAGLSSEQANFSVLRTEHYKYVHFNGGVNPLLFDLRNDPFEYHSVADQAQFQQTRLQLLSQLLDHRMSHADHALSRLKIRPDGLYGA